MAHLGWAHVGACPEPLSWRRFPCSFASRSEHAAQSGPFIIFGGEGNPSGPDRQNRGAAPGQSPPRWRRNRKQRPPPPPPPLPAKSRPAAPSRFSYPDSGLGEVGPDRDLLPRRHVRVAVPLEGGLQFLQLLAGEVSPLPPLPLLLGRIFGARLLILARLAFLFFCERKSSVGSPGPVGEREGRREGAAAAAAARQGKARREQKESPRSPSAGFTGPRLEAHARPASGKGLPAEPASFQPAPWKIEGTRRAPSGRSQRHSDRIKT